MDHPMQEYVDHQILDVGDIAYCIRQLFNYWWEGCFYAPIKVEHPSQYLYIAKIALQSVDAPYTIGGEMPLDEYLKFAKEQIKGMDAAGLFFYKVKREIWDDQTSFTENNHPPVPDNDKIDFDPVTCKITLRNERI